MKIIKLPQDQQPELAKRFYHGHEFRDNCPACGHETAQDQVSGILSYPIPGEIVVINFYCNECNTEWTRDTIMTIEFKEVKEREEKETCL